MGDQDDIFFIYDMMAMESEYDTVEESTLYIKPNLVMDSDRFSLMVGQLVGMVSFTEELTGSIPSIIRLETLKFAVLKKEKRYLLFLGSSNCSTPDAFLKNKLDRFFNLFSFFHGSIERLKHRKCFGIEEDFKNEFKEITQCYLPFAQSYNSILMALFTPVPAVEFNKASYTVFMKVNKILEACQRRESIYCGALFSEERVISSQVPEELLHNLMLLKVKQNNLPADVFRPGFECPYGIKILKVYVSPKQYAKLETVKNRSPYKRQSSKSDTNKKTRKRISKLGNNSNSSKESLADTASLEKSLSNISLESSFESSHVGRKLSADQPSVYEQELIEENFVVEVDIGNSTCKEPVKDSDHSSETATTSTTASATATATSAAITITQAVPINIDDNKDAHLPSVSSSLSAFETLSHKRDLPIFHMSAKMESDLETNRNCPVSSRLEENTSTSIVNDGVTNEQVPDEQQTIVNDEMKEMHLYVQGHSGIVLVLLMKPQKTYHLKSLKSLWEMVLPQLGDIEAQIKLLISTNDELQTIKTPDKIGYLQYDKLREKLRGNITDPVSTTDFAFFDAVNTIHYQFQNSASLKDITLRSSVTSVYGHQSHCEEIFYQPRGNYQPVHGPPSNNDVTWTFDQRVQSSRLKHIYQKNIIL